MKGDEVGAIVLRALGSVMARYRAQQLFLFGPKGEPFWPARQPISESEIVSLDAAIALIGELEATTPKPFVGRARDGSFAVAALAADSDLYLVLLERDDGSHAETRVVLMRDSLLPHVEHLSTAARRAHSSP